MLGPGLADGLRAQQAALPKPGRIEQALCPGAQRSAQPLANGDAETLLRPVVQRRRQMPSQQLPKQPFALAATNFGPQWQPPCKLDHAMIEQGTTGFEAH